MEQISATFYRHQFSSSFHVLGWNSVAYSFYHHFPNDGQSALSRNLNATTSSTTLVTHMDVNSLTSAECFLLLPIRERGFDTTQILLRQIFVGEFSARG